MRSKRPDTKAIVLGAASVAVLGAMVAWRATPGRAVRHAFTAWANGTGSIHDLMDEGTEIVIPGTTAHSGAYPKDTFLAEIAQPFVARFTNPPLPRLSALWAEGRSVVVQADATGTTNDGQPYTNEYVFIFEFSGTRVTRVTEFLDMAAFEAVWDRVEPALNNGG